MIEDIERTWALGDDYDSETCGSTYNEAGLELHGTKQNIWQLYYSLGCYDGPALQEEAARLYSQLKDLRRLRPGARQQRATYRRTLKARLRTANQIRTALCPHCLGTGNYADMHLAYQSCPTCHRPNPNYTR